MTLTVLTDHQVSALLETLTFEEVEDFRRTLALALNEYSSGAQDFDGSGPGEGRAGGDDVYQEPRGVEIRHPGRVTKYMPSAGPNGMACKITTQVAPKDTGVQDAQNNQATGLLTLLSPSGSPSALIATPTLTAFRTALSSACLLFKRPTVRTLTVFGAGSQAYWHLRLALMLRGPTIRHVNIVNHRFSASASGILKRFTLIPQDVKDREGWGGAKFSVLTPGFVEFARLSKEYIREADVIYCCTPGVSGGEGEIEGLFDASILTSHEGRKKGRLICAIGGGRELPDELVKLVTKQHHGGSHRHFHKHADEGGVIVVDTLEGALRHAVEIVEAKIEPTQLVELGELVMLHRLRLEESETSSIATSDSRLSSDLEPLTLHPEHRTPSMSSVFKHSDDTSSASPRSRSASPSPTRKRNSFTLRRGSTTSEEGGSSTKSKKKAKEEDGLVRWLRDGTVVYKSVGLGVMDMVVGMRLVKVADEKGVGTKIEGF